MNTDCGMDPEKGWKDFEAKFRERNARAALAYEIHRLGDVMERLGRTIALVSRPTYSFQSGAAR